MDKNPLEQQQAKIDVIRKELENNIGRVFDDPEELNAKIEKMVLKIESFQQAGLVFDAEKMISGIRESLNIKDKTAFISHLVKTVEPLTILRATRPHLFEKINRENMLNSDGNFKLSEVLYTSLNEGNNKEVEIHLAPSTELIKEKGMENFKKEIEIGLHKLAEIVKSDEKIKEVWATSWIVAKNPGLLKRLGFTILGIIPKEEKDSVFINEQGQKMPVAKSKISREDFLVRYGN